MNLLSKTCFVFCISALSLNLAAEASCTQQAWSQAVSAQKRYYDIRNAAVPHYNRYVLHKPNWQKPDFEAEMRALNDMIATDEILVQAQPKGEFAHTLWQRLSRDCQGENAEKARKLAEKVAELLKWQKNKTDYFVNTEFGYFAERGSLPGGLPVLKRLHEYGVLDPNKSIPYFNRNLLGQAILTGAHPELRALIKFGADINNPGVDKNGKPNRAYPIHFAIMSNNASYEAFEILADEAGADFDVTWTHENGHVFSLSDVAVDAFMHRAGNPDALASVEEQYRTARILIRMFQRGPALRVRTEQEADRAMRLIPTVLQRQKTPYVPNFSQMSREQIHDWLSKAIPEVTAFSPLRRRSGSGYPRHVTNSEIQAYWGEGCRLGWKEVLHFGTPDRPDGMESKTQVIAFDMRLAEMSELEVGTPFKGSILKNYKNTFTTEMDDVTVLVGFDAKEISSLDEILQHPLARRAEKAELKMGWMNVAYRGLSIQDALKRLKELCK